MKLFEYQAKEIFKEFGIAVPESQLVASTEELEAVVDTISLPCVVKAQVLHGGRGKAGLVKFVRTKEEALQEGKRILDVTQMQLLVEAAVEKQQEIYLSITGDPVMEAWILKRLLAPNRKKLFGSTLIYPREFFPIKHRIYFISWVLTKRW